MAILLYQPKNILIASLFLLYVLHDSQAIPKKSPVAKALPPLKSLAHGVRSGDIIIKDSRTILIQNLYYDGAGPDAYFWVGTGSKPHAGGRKIPNELGSMDVLSGYTGQDVELILPSDLTVNDIDWLSLWCVAFKENFGYTMIPKNLDVPEAVDLLSLYTLHIYTIHRHEHSSSNSLRGIKYSLSFFKWVHTHESRVSRQPPQIYVYPDGPRKDFRSSSNQLSIHMICTYGSSTTPKTNNQQQQQQREDDDEQNSQEI